MVGSAAKGRVLHCGEVQNANFQGLQLGDAILQVEGFQLLRLHRPRRIAPGASPGLPSYSNQLSVAEAEMVSFRSFLTIHQGPVPKEI